MVEKKKASLDRSPLTVLAAKSRSSSSKRQSINKRKALKLKFKRNK
jgi:hypothetical protein